MLRVLMGRFFAGTICAVCMAVRPRESPRVRVKPKTVVSPRKLSTNFRDTDKHSALYYTHLRTHCAPTRETARGHGGRRRPAAHTPARRRRRAARVCVTRRGRDRETLRSPFSSSRSSQAHDSYFALAALYLMNNSLSLHVANARTPTDESSLDLCIAQRRRRVLGARWRVIARLQPG